jgi:hypothetical protein
MVSDTRQGRASYTGSGNSAGFINSQDDNKPTGASSTWSAWPELNSEEALTDTDGDGMPDEWETAHGLDPKKASDGSALDASGYTNVEVYLNALVADITEQQNEGGTPMGSIIETGKDINDSYNICQMTSNGDGSFVDGFKLSGFSSTSQPSFGTAGTIKLSSGKQYTITIPEGITINKVTILGYCNSDGQTGYLGELAGTEYGENDYVFPARDANPSKATHTIPLSQPVSNKLTFTPKGNGQACYYITLHVDKTTGIQELTTPKHYSDILYDLQGRKITDSQQHKKGIYISQGKKHIVK